MRILLHDDDVCNSVGITEYTPYMWDTFLEENMDDIISFVGGRFEEWLNWNREDYEEEDK